MKKRMMVVVCVVLVIAGAGCEQNAAPPLPTLIPTLEPLEPPTATIQPTEAPTTAPITRPTLPPTWTPLPAPTQPPTLTPVQDIGIPVGQPTLEVCGTFRVDPSRYGADFRFGMAVTTAWMPVATATHYRVSLIDEVGDELFTDYTAETVFTFSADLFERGKRYGWTVYPIDTVGQQMCISVGDELFLR